MSTAVTYALHDQTALVTWDDGKANALSSESIAALLGALTRAEAEASALVLVGRPERFCAGFDLRTMLKSPENAVGLLTEGAELYFRLYTSPLPIVLACTGHAMAGGAILLLTGDRRLGAAGPFRIGLNEVTIGMPLPRLAIEIARDRLNPAELGRATVGAQIYDPAGATSAGYLDAVVAPDALLPTALAEAAALGKLPRKAYHATKLRLRDRTVAYLRASLAEDLADLATLLPRA